MASASALDTLYRSIQSELDQVQVAVELLWAEALELAGTGFTPQVHTNGKLLRPALCLLAAGAAGGPSRSEYVRLATAIEVMHLGALIHDDVVDGSSLRRGVASLNALWNDRMAVLAGDYLIAGALALIARYNSCALMTDVIDTIRKMAAGELSSFGRNGNRFTQKDCIELAEQKTASLFAVTCSAPTRLMAGRYGEALQRYGFAAGTAFQLIDDILDLSQDEATLGKPACGDLVEGKMTLPVFYMRESMSPSDAARLDGLRGMPLSDEDRRWACAMLECTGARVKAEAVAQSYAAKAQTALSTLPSSAYRDAMIDLAEFILIRGS